MNEVGLLKKLFENSSGKSVFKYLLTEIKDAELFSPLNNKFKLTN